MTIKSSFELNSYLRDFMFLENTPCLTQLKMESAKSKTQIESLNLEEGVVPVFINEFWTSRQRQAAPIHEISYRACFKPQLPRFFIALFTQERDRVYDPFSGRGTTVLQAGLMGRDVVSNDVNPLSRVLSCPRLCIPELDDVRKRLDEIPLSQQLKAEIDLSMFYHPGTEGEILSLKGHLIKRKKSGTEDDVDRWIRMVATNRLTGHSPGFFSVYTLPPNQAVSPERQKRINQKRNQAPEYRDTRKLILKKTASLVKKLTTGEKNRLRQAGHTALFLEKDARDTPEIADGSVQLTVTSPPFLDVVQYSQDNWLRCWFNDIDSREVENKLTMASKLNDWTAVMGGVFNELFRITRQGGWVAFEVGEVRSGTVRLEEHVIPLGLEAGFSCEGVLINRQDFTKTSNIWGINNNRSGTNTNRIVLFKKATSLNRRPVSS